MERSTAVKRLRKILGKNFAFSINIHAPTAEQRATANAAAPELETAVRLANEMLEARRKEILDRDVAYQQLLLAAKAARTAKSVNEGRRYQRKIEVGTNDRLGGFSVFHVEAHGDSWEQIFAKLAARKSRAA